MLHDVRLVLWLRIRHMRTFIARLFHAVGSDPLSDNGVSERVFQLYAAAIGVIWVVLMWAALLDACGTFFGMLGAVASAAVLSTALLVPVFVLAVSGVKAIQTSPLKLSHPDILFVAASPLSTRALVAVSAARTLALGGVSAAFAGFALGVGLNAGMRVFLAPLPCALIAALLVAVALGGVWVVGVARLAFERKGRRKVVALLFLMLATAVVCATLALVFVVPSVFVSFGGVVVACVCSLVLVGGEATVLAVLAPRVDMTTVIEENALFADLQQFGMFSPLDPTTIADYRRRRKIAARGPLFHMPVAQGRGALVAHAGISLVRQYTMLPNLLMQGALVAPLGVIALLGGGGPILLLFWLAALVLFPDGVRPATSVFRDDVRVRLVRDRLPFGTLELLVCDSLPAFILVNVVSCAIVAFGLPVGVPLVAALLCAVLINTAVVLSCGLDVVSLFRSGPRPFYELGAFALVLFVGVLSLAGSALLVLAGIAVVCGVVAFVVCTGIERAW